MKNTLLNTRNDLADFLGIKRSTLSYVLYKNGIDNYYVNFKIQKKTGGTRDISAPTGALKSIQKIIAKKLVELKYPNSIPQIEQVSYQVDCRTESKNQNSVAQGFVKGKSFITNANFHKNKRYIVTFDISDFFTQFHFGRVMGYFEKNRCFSMSHSVAIVLAQLTCYQGCLPQGAPTSPVIANFICEIIDQRLLKIAKRYKLDYTRYADDLTFSTNNRIFYNYAEMFVAEIVTELAKDGLPVNNSKTRICFHDSQQKVTGLIVNIRPNINREYQKTTRAMCNYLYSGKDIKLSKNTITVDQLTGRIGFQYQILKYNKAIAHMDTEHSTRFIDFQRYLFFTTFINTDKPLIITEGKTDVLYLKAALKSLHNSFPELIHLSNKGIADYQLTFFKRTDMIKTFFKISGDGADALSKIICLFMGKDRMKSCYRFFLEKYNRTPQFPIILLFDNENEKDHPLTQVQNRFRDGIDKNELKENLFTEIIPVSNLYIATNPNVDNCDLCPIEHLFTTETKNTKINNKVFSDDNNYDKSKYYGKDIFSKYVFNHYNSVDFTGFKKLLSTFNQIIVKSREVSKSKDTTIVSK